MLDRYTYLPDDESIRRKLLLRVSLDLDTGCWNWSGATQTNGYGSIRLTCLDGKSHSYTVHRLAAIVFGILDRASDLFACHICNNPACFNPQHLYAGTMSDNILDAYEDGLMHMNPTRGEDHPRHVLTSVSARMLKERVLAGEPQRALAKEFGVSKSLVAGIKYGRNWGWLEVGGADLLAA